MGTFRRKFGNYNLLPKFDSIRQNKQIISTILARTGPNYHLPDLNENDSRKLNLYMRE